MALESRCKARQYKVWFAISTPYFLNFCAHTNRAGAITAMTSSEDPNNAATGTESGSINAMDAPAQTQLNNPKNTNPNDYQIASASRSYFDKDWYT